MTDVYRVQRRSETARCFCNTARIARKNLDLRMSCRYSCVKTGSDFFQACELREQ